MAPERTVPKTLFLYPAIDGEWKRMKGGEQNVRNPSLGLQYLMAAMKQAGYPFAMRDQVIHPTSTDALVEDVRSGRFQVVGLHANVMTKIGVERYIRIFRDRTSAKVIVGGPGAVEAEDYVNAGADVVCVGEAEQRLVPILETLVDGGDRGTLPGICYRDGSGKVQRTQPAQLLEDLDQLPIPYRPPELVPQYGEPVNPAQRGVFVSIIASRGCHFNCTFCTSPEIWGHRVRSRTVGNVLMEMEAVLAEWPRAYFNFVDDVFGESTRWVEEFCQALLERGRPCHWKCILHPLSYHKERERLIPLMARAGCNAISFGAQSSSPEILRNIRRSPREPAELARTVELCRRNHILTIITFIFGLPGETQQTVRQSIDWTAKHGPHLVDFHPLAVLPGSQIADTFRDRPITGLSRKDIDEACARAFRRFYLRPATAARLIRFSLRRNPAYFFRLFYPAKQLIGQMLTQRGRTLEPLAHTPPPPGTHPNGQPMH